MYAIRRQNLERPGYSRLPLESSSSASLVEVLWCQRWTVVGTALACLILAGIYLLLATKIYSATAKVLIEQNPPAALAETHTPSTPSESFVPTQADVFQSGSVLAHALDTVHFHDFKTFANAGADPIAWLQKGNGFRVEVGKKSDVILVTMESPVAQEASDFANAVVASYMAEQATHMKAAGDEMIKSLQNEKDQILQQRDAALAAMQKCRRDNSLISLGSDKGNTTVDRVASLSSSLTTAEVATFSIRADLKSTQAALADPTSLSAFVEAQQFKSKETGDREYDDLRSELIQQTLLLANASAIQGSRHARVTAQSWVVEQLQKQVAEKERQIASAHLASLQTELDAAIQNEEQLRAALKTQKDQVLEMTPAADEYVRLEANVAEIQKQCELIDGRIGEVTVNNVDTQPLNVLLLESARPSVKPIKPNKLMILAAAMILGGLAGIGLALAREWKDSRLRSPAEILATLNTPVIATVPPLNPMLSSVARGQILYLDSHSLGAEAYRSIRTSLQLGPCRDARTILLASPTVGDGKSTTASNLAIAFAQAGHRTLLIDCDLREPVLHMIFETDSPVGLTSVIAGEEKLRDAIFSTRVPGLYVLPCGPIPSNPSELLAGRRFSQLMKSLLSTFDRIILDSPPLTNVADGHILAAAADATLLVLRMNKSSRKLGMLAVEGLEKVGANLLGAIANDLAPARDSRYAGGSWQYASAPKRLMPSEGATFGKERNGEGGKDPLQHDDGTLAIEEPDWSADGGAMTSVATMVHANPAVPARPGDFDRTGNDRSDLDGDDSSGNGGGHDW